MTPTRGSVRRPCHYYPELFIAPDGQSPGARNYRARVANAREVCIECPIMLACRDEARTIRAFGVWGGEDDAERTAAGYAPVPIRTPPPCGTKSGAKQHRAAGQRVCPACLKAERIPAYRPASKTAA